MAEMIPERLPQSATESERRVFRFLKRLPGEDIVYYETAIANRRPDFVVISPVLGILVIEVKGWSVGDIVAGDDRWVDIRFNGRLEKTANPLYQAFGYVRRVLDVCKTHAEYRTITNDIGLVFPVAKLAIFPFISKNELRNHTNGDLFQIFSPKCTVCRDDLARFLRLQGDSLRDALKPFFDPVWSFVPMTAEQMKIVRAAVHPEIRIEQMTLPGSIEPQQPDIKVLDLQQERYAASIGDGHRIIYGVPGSGKTVLLIARAKLLHIGQPHAQILVLCSNVALAAYLSGVLEGMPRITVLHFDGWAIRNGARRHNGEEDDDLGDRLLERLRSSERDSRRFDAVLVDEAQDFSPSWFRCVLAAMKDPEDGDLLIVGDGAQSLRVKKRLVWKSVGVKAQGRTMNEKLGLNRNYRNSKEIVRLASRFFADTPEETEDQLGCIRMTPEAAIRATGQKPVVALCRDRRRECDLAVVAIERLVGGKTKSLLTSFQAHEIAVLYPRLERPARPAFERFLETLGEIADFVWLSNKDGNSRRRVNDPGVKVQTIDSAKGLQYRAVILLWADLMTEGPFDRIDETRRLYVGLTRAQDFLCVTTSSHSAFQRFTSEAGPDSVTQWIYDRTPHDFRDVIVQGQAPANTAE